MQDWQNTGQPGAAQGQGNVWPNTYTFADENAQFSNIQGWHHGQNAYSHSTAEPSPPVDSGLYGHPQPVQVQTTHAGSHASVPTLNQGPFHATQTRFAVDEPYAQSAQGQSIQNINYPHQASYGQQGAATQQNPQFSQNHFQYQGQTTGSFNGRVPQQYSDPQLITQPRQQTQTAVPQQHFEPPQQTFSPAHDFSQAPRAPQPQAPQQPAQQQSRQQQVLGRAAPPDRGFAGSPQQYQHQHIAPQPSPSQAYTNPTQPPYHQSSPPAYQHQQVKFVPQQMSYAPSTSAAPFQTIASRQVSDQNIQQQSFVQPSSTPLQQTLHASAPTQARPSESDLVAEQQLKKRKRVIKKDGEFDVVGSPGDFSTAGPASSNNVTPFSSEAELAILAQFKSRPAAARKTFPAITGAPLLASTSIVNIPFAKSYDRLSPMVALPSPNGKRALPELGYDLPCEIQGRFTDKYRPSAISAAKLADREKEAKPLIDEYERGMRALGTRRPKYADYPFAFSEQLKADEAARSKAQRKARKEEEEERKKPLRSPTRPTDPVEAAAWDMLGIANIDVSAMRTSALIADRVRKVGEFLIGLRTEMVRAKSEVDQRVKEAQPAPAIAEAKQDLELKKEMYIRACEAAERHGDDAVLENLGGHQKGVLSMVNALIGCVKAVDYSGRLPKSLLRLMSNISMSKKIAEAVHFENVRKRFADKGDDEVKELVRTVVSRIKKEVEATNGTTDGKKPAQPVPTSAAAGPLKAAGRLGAPAKPVAEVSTPKRPLDDDATDSRPVKKPNVEGPGTSLGASSGGKVVPKPPAAGTLSSRLQGARPRLPSSSLAAKNRLPVKPAAKPDVPRSDASKSEGMSPSTAMDIDQPTALKRPKPDPAKAAPVKAAPAKAAASSSSLSSIGSLLDSINSKPEVQSTKKDVAKSETPETPEQRAKRLRKESRRLLRVTWKPESELTQVRIFHKEAAEDENNMTQDAADDRSEGMMLKHRAKFADEEDEEEDDELSGRAWSDPLPADLSGIPQEYRDKAYVTRGGTLKFHTDEQKAMEEREQRELMVIYTDVSDIPPTPKSPVPEPSLPDSDAQIGRLPQDGDQFKEIQLRWRESQQHGPEAASYYAKTRLSAKADPGAKLQSLLGGMQPAPGEVVPEGYNYNMTPPQKHAQLAQLQAANSNTQLLYVPPADQVLALLQSDAVKNWRDPNPYNPSAPRTQRRFDYADAAIQVIANLLEDLFEQHKGLPYPATQPPAWLKDPERIREWLTGYQKDVVARGKREAEEKARTAAQATAQQAHAAAQSSQGSQDAWAAYFQQQQQQQAPQQQQQQDVYAQYMAVFQQMQQAQAQQPAAASVAGQSAPLGDDQVQALLAQINQPPPQAALPAQAGNTYNLNPNDQGYQQLMMLAQLQQQQQQQQPQAQAAQLPQDRDERPRRQADELDYDDAYEPHREHRDDYGRDRERDWDRDKDRDFRDRRDDRRESRDRHEHDSRREKHNSKARKGNAPGGATLPPHRPANKALIGTKPCVFWQQGKCARGDKCTFRHDN